MIKKNTAYPKVKRLIAALQYLTILCLPLLASPAAAQKKKNLTASFSDAMQQYNNGDFRGAAKQFSKLIRRYPSYSPARVQFALSLYNLENYYGSNKAFNKIDPQDLPDKFYFEFGYTSYILKEWPECASQFPKVPETHPFYDLAMYYAGVCSFNIGDYESSKIYLQKASVLPSSFSSSRRALLKISKKQITKSKSKSKPKKTVAKGVKATDEDLSNLLAKLWLRKPEHSLFLKYSNQSNRPYNDGMNFEPIHNQTLLLGGSTGLDYTFKGDDVMALGLDIRVDGYSLDLAESQSIFLYEDENRELQLVYQSLSDKKSNLGIVGATPWYEVGLGNHYLGLELAIDALFSSFENTDMVVSYEPKIYLYSNNLLIDYQVNLSNYQALDGSDKKFNQIDFFGELNYDFKSEFSVMLDVSYYNNKYGEVQLEGPAEFSKIGLTGKQVLPIKTDLSATFFASNISNYAKPLTEQTVLTANGSSFGFSGKIDVKPLSWLGLTLEQTIVAHTWKNVKPENSEAVWNDFVPTFEDPLEINIVINKKF